MNSKHCYKSVSRLSKITAEEKFRKKKSEFALFWENNSLAVKVEAKVDLYMYM